MLLDQLRREPIVAGRHRRMRREDDLRRDAADAFLGPDALGDHAVADEFERSKRAVAFVEMRDRRRDAQHSQRAHAADAEQEFLANPHPVVAAIEAGGELPILRTVALDVGIEQQQRVASHRQLPHARRDGGRARVDGHDHRRARRVGRRLHGQQAPIDIDVVFLLVALVVEPLPEVRLVVVEPDAHQRDAEIGGALDVIARQDAQAARVDRNGLVQAELRREVRDRPRPQHAGVLQAPCLAGRQVLLHPAVGVVDPAVQDQLVGALLQVVDVDALQQRDRVVSQLAPQHRIELPEQRRRVVVPAPPEVLGQRTQSLVRRRDEQSQRAGLADDRRQLQAGGLELAHGVGTERAWGERLHYQNALQQPAVDQRHAEKRLVRVLARLAEILEARVRRRVLDHLRQHLLADQADQALGEPHADLADALGAKPDRRRQHQRGAVRLEQIHRAHVSAEALLDQPDEVRESLSRVSAFGHQARDLVAGPECGLICGGGAVGHGVVTE